MLDRYKHEVPVKGNFVMWNPEVIIVTCPRIPDNEFVRHEKN